MHMETTYYNYFVDGRGRVGRLLSAKSRECEYAYGPGKYPRQVIDVIGLSEKEFHHRFQRQREQMWADVLALRRIAVIEAKRVAPKNLIDELVADVGIPMLCYVAVTHVAKRASLESYAKMAVRKMYVHSLLKHKRAKKQIEEAEFDQMPENCREAEHIAKDELYSLGLTDDQMNLLLLRYDTGMSLDEIAIELNVASRGTPHLYIKRIIEQCRAMKNARSL